MNKIKYETINPDANEVLVVWLHGLGADGFDFIPIVRELKFPNKEKVNFIFPHAPIIPVTINGGMTMRAWYDIYEMDIDRKVDLDGIKTSTDLILDLIHEIQDVKPFKKIIIAGFSQGGVVSLDFLSKHGNMLSGAIALSCYHPNQDIQIKHRMNNSVFMAHGEYDSVIPINLGLKAHDYLSANGIGTVWKTYQMAHQVCQEEIQDISNYLGDIVNGN